MPDINTSEQAAEAARRLHEATEHLKKANEQLGRTTYDEPNQWDNAMNVVREAEQELDQATDDLGVEAQGQAGDEPQH
jgi:hypothetical protein